GWLSILVTLPSVVISSLQIYDWIENRSNKQAGAATAGVRNPTGQAGATLCHHVQGGFIWDSNQHINHLFRTDGWPDDSHPRS
ncbi:MAG TPA: hypothetical protein VIX20_06675, partial [Ktedonobacteraceae bacterium]